MNKLNKLSVSKIISISLLALTLFMGFVPAVQAKQYKCSMEVYFNHDVWDNPTTFIWNGSIHGDIEGVMTFWVIGYGGPGRDVGNVHFFAEKWVIYTEDGFIEGIDSGSTGYANWRFRMNAIVTDASGIYVDFVGRRVHMHGQITWWSLDELGRPETGIALGPVNI